ncbi:MAG TPA: 50S ribosomal protein L4 [Phycisphaerae bacterium]|nr:50S ribosomal protein L4 [Phycisphaerae bacterium]
MISVPVYNMSGEQTGSMQVDEAQLGGKVRFDLLKQAVVMWQTNQRQGSARTKNRARVEGSTRKLFRQKGTGNARAGTVRSPIRRGGGRAFAKLERNYRRTMPKRMRQLARNSALLAKMQAGNVLVVDPLVVTEPKTKPFFQMLKKLGADSGCLLAMEGSNTAIFKSGRNIPKTEIRQVQELNAYEILRRKKLIMTRKALEVMVPNSGTARAAGAEA